MAPPGWKPLIGKTVTGTACLRTLVEKNVL